MQNPTPFHQFIGASIKSIPQEYLNMPGHTPMGKLAALFKLLIEIIIDIPDMKRVHH